jgi:hypothetical protein
MYNGISSQDGPHGKGMIYSLYFIILLLFGNCKLFPYIIFNLSINSY